MRDEVVRRAWADQSDQSGETHGQIQPSQGDQSDQSKSCGFDSHKDTVSTRRFDKLKAQSLPRGSRS